MDPFTDSQQLANWTASILVARHLDEVANWRMVEYWIQVELFRAVQSGSAPDWHHIGDFEHPYYTGLPKSGSKTNTKWIDLVFSRPNPKTPETVVWCELKDLGRSRATAKSNAKGLGIDLAALWALDPIKTKELWLNPPAHSKDRGRLLEWNQSGNGLAKAKHMISQIALCHKSLCAEMAVELMKELWLSSFASRTGVSLPSNSYSIATSETGKFVVFGLVGEPAYG